MNEKNQARLRLMSIFLTSVGMSVNEFYAIGIQGTIASGAGTIASGEPLHSPLNLSEGIKLVYKSYYDKIS